MHAFGMIVLLGLAVFGVGAIAYRYLAIAREFWALLLVLLGVGAAWLANFNLFAAWGLGVRNTAIAVTLTGLVIAGIGYVSGEIVSFFTGLSRKFTDEAETIEKSEKLRRVA